MLWRTDLPGLSSSSRQLLTPCCCCRDRAWPTMSAADSLVGGFCRPQHRTAQRHQQRLPATGRIQSRSLSTSQSDNQRPTVSLQHQRTGLSDWDVKDAATSSTVASAVANAERVSSHAKASTSGARQPRLVIIDAHALLYRVHYSFGFAARLKTQGGQDTSIEYGFINTMLGLMEEEPQPSHFAVVFDARGKNFRHELYHGYKGHRTPMPDEIRETLPRLHDLVMTMGVARFMLDGVEADDVIATLATRAVDTGMLVDIASPDKDFFQLLRPGLQLLRPIKKEDLAEGRPQRAGMVAYTEQRFREDFGGLDPQRFADMLALMGDASDNVPGVKGLGPKTALPLLLQFGTVEELLERVDEIPKKPVRERLSTVEGAAAARLSKKLVQLQTHMDLPPLRIDIERELRLQIPGDKGLAIQRAFSEMEFTQHSRRLKNIHERLHGVVSA